MSASAFEKCLQLVDTLTFISTTAPLMVQNVAEVLDTYCQLQEDIRQVINDLGTLLSFFNLAEIAVILEECMVSYLYD